jgi:hypothetical protein
MLSCFAIIVYVLYFVKTRVSMCKFVGNVYNTIF